MQAPRALFGHLDAFYFALMREASLSQVLSLLEDLTCCQNGDVRGEMEKEG
jgi:hypothetical protein